MQTTGYVIVNGEKVKVLVRDMKHGRALKKRDRGREGQHFVDESAYLEQEPAMAKALLKGNVVIC